MHPDAHRRMLDLLVDSGALKSIQRQVAEFALVAQSAAVPVLRMNELAESMVGALRPALLQQTALQAAMQSAIAPAVAAQAAQAVGLVRFSDVLRQQRVQLLDVLGSPGVQTMLRDFASAAAVAAARDLVESADPDVIDAELEESATEAEIDSEFAGFLQQLVEQVNDAMTDRNAVVAVVYLIVLAKCIELALLATAPLGLLALIVGGSGHAVARTAARAAGGIVDRLSAADEGPTIS